MPSQNVSNSLRAAALVVALTGLSASFALGQDQAAPAPAQAAAPAPPASPIGSLRTPLANLQTAIGNLSISRWKASNDVRSNALQDVNSMQKDLTATLPGLLTQAENAPANTLSPSFAVFRNLDALYDVLLRVTETAALTGPASDASNLESARAGLEDGRARLGAWLLDAIGGQDARVAKAVAAPPPAAAPAAPNKIIVDDGPPNPKPRKKKPATTQAPQ